MTRTSRKIWRDLFCTSDPVCAATCGRCRTKATRARRFHESITDEEFYASLDHFAGKGEGPRYGAIRRYVHETLRRRNEPYHGDTKLCVRMSQADLEMAKANAEQAGLTLQDYAFAALAIVKPSVVAETWKRAFSKA